MKWVMKAEEVEAVLETIWDLHDKLSDAIHSISRSHFANTKRRRPSQETGQRHPPDGAGFVFMKGFVVSEDNNGDAMALAEARSLDTIRSALENLEDQLEFFHTVQSQQLAERDAAIARLEQSRIILAMRLADHQGKRYKVIEEALAFVDDVHGPGCFVAPENLYETRRSQSGMNLEDQEGNRSNILMQMLISSLKSAKNSFKLERLGSVLGNAALFAVSVLSLLQFQQVNLKSETSQVQQQTIYKNRNEKNVSQLGNSSRSSQLKHFDVFSARG